MKFDPKAIEKLEPIHILDYWFGAEMKKHWFASTPEIDADLSYRYLDAWLAASSAALDHWQEDAEGALALVILLDQIPLNIFRDTPKSFSTEEQARRVGRCAIDNKWDEQLSSEQRPFLYLPFMHSENLQDQRHSLSLYSKLGSQELLHWAQHHYDLILKFGRFPHRNAVLGRKSNEDELKYLSSSQAFNP